MQTLNLMRRSGVSAIALFVLVNAAVVSPRAQGGAEVNGMVGMAIGGAMDDAQRPARFNYDPARTVWSLHGSLFLQARLAIGSEWVHLGTIEAPGGPPRGPRIVETHREHALFGTLRARLAEYRRRPIDVVGGMGALLQRRDTQLLPGGTTSITNRSPAFVIRAEGQLALSRHVAVTPTAGLYALRRHDATASLLNLSRTRPSTRGFVGIGVSALW